MRPDLQQVLQNGDGLGVIQLIAGTGNRVQHKRWAHNRGQSLRRHLVPFRRRYDQRQMIEQEYQSCSICTGQTVQYAQHQL